MNEARTRRRRLLLWSAPVVAGLLVVAIKLVTAAVFAQHGVDAVGAGSYGAGDGDFARLGTANVVQRWIAPFDRGDSLFDLKRYPAAEYEFRRALALAPPPRRCDVRQNLSLTAETIGDQAVRAGSKAAAVTAYRRALAAATDSNCRQLAGPRVRIAQKLKILGAAASKPKSSKQPGRAAPSAAPPDQQQRLQQRNRAAARRDSDDRTAFGKHKDRIARNGKNW